MQVIKFRGRSIADGSIVYGGVLQYATASFIVQPDTRHADASPRCIEVHPDSVAQYINKKDVQGWEIYTGDKLIFYDLKHDLSYIGIVRYCSENAAFYIDGSAADAYLPFEPEKEYRILT